MAAAGRNHVKIKLCGLRREEDIRIVNEMMPEYAGFILAEGRRRTITPEKMAELSAGLDRRIQKVAVFLDQDPDWICWLADQGLMDVIQLHGSEGDDVIRMIRARTGKIVIKAITDEKPVKTGTSGRGVFAQEAKEVPETFDKTGKQAADPADRARSCPADLILLDHGGGGSGMTIDWTLTGRIRRDFILAGGLTPGNVREAIEKTHPMAVDVSSGVETDSVKDMEKVRRFVHEVRSQIPFESASPSGRSSFDYGIGIRTDIVR